MITQIKTYQNLPFEEGKTYTTKWATGEKYTLKRIIWKTYGTGDNTTRVMLGFEGIFANSPHIGLCPLGVDRLIPERIEVSEIDVCSHCLKPIK